MWLRMGWLEWSVNIVVIDKIMFMVKKNFVNWIFVVVWILEMNGK